jgi:hypothetical protein
MDPEQVRQAWARIEREYRELPGLSLTEHQVRRLWQLPGELCEAALDELVRRDFLVRTAGGTFLRRTTLL